MDTINFILEDVKLPLAYELSDFFSLWIKNVVSYHKKKIGEVNYIFCSDDYILKINKEYLNHDYFTDIITFNYNEGGVISGDVFISLDTVKDNAEEFSNGDFYEELDRVVIHGILHLIGFNDKTDSDQLEMTKQEDYALSLRDVSRETL